MKWKIPMLTLSIFMITPPHLLQFEETQRAKKAGPSPHLVIQIPFMHGTLKKKTAHASWPPKRRRYYKPSKIRKIDQGPGRSPPILSLATSRVRPHDDPTLYIRATGPQVQKARSAKNWPTMHQLIWLWSSYHDNLSHQTHPNHLCSRPNQFLKTGQLKRTPMPTPFKCCWPKLRP